MDNEAVLNIDNDTQLAKAKCLLLCLSVLGDDSVILQRSFVKRREPYTRHGIRRTISKLL